MLSTSLIERTGCRYWNSISTENKKQTAYFLVGNDEQLINVLHTLVGNVCNNKVEQGKMGEKK